MDHDGRRRYISADPPSFLEFMRKRATFPKLEEAINNFALTSVSPAVGSALPAIETPEEVNVILSITPGYFVLRACLTRKVKGYRWDINVTIPDCTKMYAYCFLETDREDCFINLYLEDDVNFWNKEYYP